MSEKKQILDFICERSAFHDVKGRSIWIELANSGVTNRTWQGLKETFLKRIYPDIRNPYYKLSTDQLSQFRTGYNSNNRGHSLKDNKRESSVAHVEPTPNLINFEETSSDSDLELSQTVKLPNNVNLELPSLNFKSDSSEETERTERNEICNVSSSEESLRPLKQSTQVEPEPSTSADHNERTNSPPEIIAQLKNGISSSVHSESDKPANISSDDSPLIKKKSTDSDSVGRKVPVEVVPPDSDNIVDKDLRVNRSRASGERPMYAVHKNKLYPIYCGDPVRNSEFMPRCYTNEKHLNHNRSRSRVLENKREMSELSSEFCCLNLERLYFKHLSRYVNDDGLSPKPEIRNYLKINNSAKFTHSAECLRGKRARSRSFDPLDAELNYSQREIQVTRDFPNKEMELQYYKDMERYYSNGQVGMRPRKESYQRALMTDKIRKYKQIHNYKGKPCSKKNTSIYIRDSSEDDEKMLIETNITQLTNKINTRGKADDESLYHWKSKFMSEKTKNDLICRLILSGCDRETLVRALDLENVYGSTCKAIERSEANEKVDTEVPPNLAAGGLIKISVAKNRTESTDMVVKITENNTNRIIDFLNDLNKSDGDNAKNKDVIEITSLDADKVDANLQVVADPVEKEPNKNTVDAIEKEIFESIIAENVNETECEMNRELFTTQELELLLSDSPPIVAEERPKAGPSIDHEPDKSSSFEMENGPSENKSLRTPTKENKKSRKKNNYTERMLKNLEIDCVESTFRASPGKRRSKGSDSSTVSNVKKDLFNSNASSIKDTGSASDNSSVVSNKSAKRRGRKSAPKSDEVNAEKPVESSKTSEITVAEIHAVSQTSESSVDEKPVEATKTPETEVATSNGDNITTRKRRKGLSDVSSKSGDEVTKKKQKTKIDDDESFFEKSRFKLASNEMIVVDSSSESERSLKIAEGKVKKSTKALDIVTAKSEDVHSDTLIINDISKDLVCANDDPFADTVIFDESNILSLHRMIPAGMMAFENRNRTRKPSSDSLFSNSICSNDSRKAIMDEAVQDFLTEESNSN